MFTKHRRLLFLILALAVLGGLCVTCDTSSRVQAPFSEQNILNADDDGSDDDSTPPDRTAPDPPQVNAPISPTGLDFQSIKGTSEPGADIIITGGLAEATGVVDEQGKFCVEVALKIDEMNYLKVYAQDAAENKSQPTAINIDQQITNYALIGTPNASSISHSKPHNTPDKAIDNDYQTYWENTTQPVPWIPESLYYPQWFSIKLDRDYWVNRVEIYWGRDTIGSYEYGTKFDVYINTQDEPAKMPHEVPAGQWANYGYVLIRPIEQAADAGIQHNAIDLTAAPVQARWVFLVLYEGNQKGILPGPDGQILYSYEVAELEIYGYAYPDNGCE